MQPRLPWFAAAWVAITLVTACQDPSGPASGAPSAAVRAATLSPPSMTTAAALSETRIQVGWQDNSSIESGFDVFRAPGSTEAFALVATVGPNAQAFTDNGLTSASPYCYKVRAFRTTGNRVTRSTFSPLACATTPAPPPPPPPPPPSAPQPASGAVAVPIASTMVSVGWTDNSSNEAGFRVERSDDSGATWSLAATMGTDANQMSFDTVAEEEACFRVTAYNAGGEAPPSNIACATTGPAAPTALTGVLLDQVTVELTWTDNSSLEEGYQVWVANCVVICNQDGSTFSYLVAELPANSTGHRTSLVSVQNLWIWVVATGGGFESLPSNYILLQAP